MESGVKFGEPSHIDHSFATDPNLTYENYELQHTKEDNLDWLLWALTLLFLEVKSIRIQRLTN